VKRYVLRLAAGNPADTVRMYTVEPGKKLSGTWNIGSQYDLTVYGPNGFVRYFKGSISTDAAALSVRTRYGEGDHGTVELRITNIGTSKASVMVLDAYTGDRDSRLLWPGETLEDDNRLDRFHGWYDLIVKVSEDPTFEYRLAGHVETGDDSRIRRSAAW